MKKSKMFLLCAFCYAALCCAPANQSKMPAPLETTGVLVAFIDPVTGEQREVRFQSEDAAKLFVDSLHN